ncbi:hypothetical protein QTN25_004354 [Entamoeba marina]
MLFIILCNFLLFSCAQTYWHEYNNNGIIAFAETGTNTNWEVTSDGTNYIDTFTFYSSCCSQKQMKFYNTEMDNEWGKYFKFDSDNLNLEILIIDNMSQQQQHQVDTNNMKNGLVFFFGCYSGSTNCRTYVNDDKRTLIEVYDKQATFYTDNIDQKFTFNYHQSTDAFQQPFVFLGGSGQQTLIINVLF